MSVSVDFGGLSGSGGLDPPSSKIRIVVEARRNRAGILVFRSVGTVPGILGLVGPRFRPKSGSKSKISSRILNIFRGPDSSLEKKWGTSQPVSCRGLQARWVHPNPSNCPMLLDGASGPGIRLPGRISAGFWSTKLQNWPSGRPWAGRRADFEAFPAKNLAETWPKSAFLTITCFPRGPVTMTDTSYGIPEFRVLRRPE